MSYEFDPDVIIHHLNIEDIINHYQLEGKLTRDQFIGLCPIHDDSRPSFSISLDKDKSGQWQCWGCGEKGNIFHLIQQIEKVNFTGSLKWLANFVGLSSSYVPTIEYAQKLLENLNKIFEEEPELEIIELPPFCESAMEHLHIAKKRVSKKDIKKYDIKYCVNGKYFGSLIIPIVFEKKLVAFFARDMIGVSEKSKRYNYGAKIGKIFFNWDEAILYPDYVIIVEGIFDCLKVLSFGYNCVALLGISLSIKKTSLLLKHFKKIYIVLDNDCKVKYDSEGNEIIMNPGQLAAEKLINKLKDDFYVYNCLLPPDTDPDECDEETFASVLKSAKKYS